LVHTGLEGACMAVTRNTQTHQRARIYAVAVKMYSANGIILVKSDQCRGIHKVEMRTRYQLCTEVSVDTSAELRTSA